MGTRRTISKRNSAEIAGWKGLKFSKEQMESAERTASARDQKRNESGKETGERGRVG